jgi:hypothetical protein
MPTSLFTATPHPAGGPTGAAVNLGNNDAYATIERSGGFFTITVNGVFRRAEPGDPAFTMNGAMRSSVQSYVDELVADLGGVVTTSSVEVAGVEVGVIPASATLITITNTYTGLSEEGLVLTETSSTDDGGRLVEFSLTFSRPISAELSTPPMTVRVKPAGGSYGSSINLGNASGYISAEISEGFERYTVNATYTRETGVATPGSRRSAAQSYYKDLVEQLGGVRSVIAKVVDGATYGVVPASAPLIRLQDSFTGLDELDLVLTEASFEDNGHNTVQFSLTFVRPVEIPLATTTRIFVEQHTGPATFGAPIYLGSTVGYVVPGSALAVPTFTVTTTFTAATRTDAEAYVSTLSKDLTCYQLVSALGRLVPRAAAKAFRLKNPLTSLEEPHLYCTDISSEDDGNNTYSLTIVFQRPEFRQPYPTLLAAPATNLGFFLWPAVSANPLGMYPAIVSQQIGRDFETLTVSVIYAPDNTGADTPATHFKVPSEISSRIRRVTQVELPLAGGKTLSFGAARESFSHLGVSYSGYYLTAASVDAVEDLRVITLTFVKGTADA